MTLRRVVAGAALILLSAAPAIAQGFGYGGKAGMNLFTVSFEQDDSIAVSAKPAIVAGGFITIGLGSRLSVEVDGYYSERKFRFAEGDIVDTLSYIELPMLARFRIVTKEGWNVAAVGGAAVSFLQKAKETISGTAYDIKDAVSSTETSGVIGAQVQVGRRLVFDVRYLLGFTDVYAAEDFPAKSRGFQITGGYRFK